MESVGSAGSAGSVGSVGSLVHSWFTGGTGGTGQRQCGKWVEMVKNHLGGGGSMSMNVYAQR